MNKLINYMKEKHNVTLLESDIDEIERIVGEHFIYCPYCGEEMPYKVSTDVSSGRCCNNIACGNPKF